MNFPLPSLPLARALHYIHFCFLPSLPSLPSPSVRQSGRQPLVVKRFHGMMIVLFLQLRGEVKAACLFAFTLKALFFREKWRR